MADAADVAMGDSEETTQEVFEVNSVAQERGIDVSNWQGNINWPNVAKAGIKHAYIKMSEGGSFVDQKFVQNWNEAQKAGIKVNCYHYFRGGSSSPQQQFDNIKKVMKTVKFDPAKHSLAIDVEGGGNENVSAVQMADNLNALLQLINKDSVLSKQKTMIYTSSGYWDTKVKYDKYNFSAYRLWVAIWEVQNPRIPASWKNANKSWDWWQHSSKGKVNGIAGDVDLDWVKT